MMTLISWTAKQRLNLTFIHSWRVLSAPTGPIQALNPNWIFTKEENHRGQSTLPFSSQAWPSDSFLHLAPSPSLLNKNNALPGFFSGGWKLAHRMIIPANPQHADKILEPWNGATSSCWSSRWWATPFIKGLAYRCVLIICESSWLDTSYNLNVSFCCEPSSKFNLNVDFPLKMNVSFCWCFRRIIFKGLARKCFFSVNHL